MVNSVEEYFYIAGAKPIPLSIKYKDKLLPWKTDRLTASAIYSYLEGCRYKLYLIAEGILEEDIPEDQKRSMTNGSENHKNLQKEVGAQEIDVSQSKLISLLRNSFRKEQILAEFKLVGNYKGLKITGKPDIIVLKNGDISSLEEWKFTASSKPKVRDSFRIQTLVYSYLIKNWLGTELLPTSIKVFSLDKEIKDPLIVENTNFDSSSMNKTTKLLEELFLIFTGKIDCNDPGDPFYCRFCRVKTSCKFCEDTTLSFNHYKLAFAAGPKAIKN